MLYNICNKCGTPVPRHAKVCTNCGSFMTQEEPQQTNDDAQQKAKKVVLQKAKEVAQQRAKEAAKQRAKEAPQQPVKIAATASNDEEIVEVVVENNVQQVKKSRPVKPQAQSDEFETEIQARRPFTPAPPFQQAPVYQQAPPPMQLPMNQGFTPPTVLPPNKKSKGPMIILIIALILAILGVGGWAVYHYYIKPHIEGMVPYSTDADIDGILESYSTKKSETSTGNTKDDETQRKGDVQQGSKNNEPWGMTDEEAAQNRQNKQTKKNTSAKQNKQKNNEPWGMTDEEAAQMRNNRRNKPAAGEPWGMTDEEAAQMRKSQQRNRRR